MDNEKKIYVYADFGTFHNCLVGTIYVSRIRDKETYSFEYDNNWLTNQNMILDPDLRLYKGRQYTSVDRIEFGVFSDSCPDRWGRRLMNRREEIRARLMNEKPKKLLESDYLLGVYDESRMGGLRFKLDRDGEFLSSDKEYATPPWASLRELEQASVAFEENENGNVEKWLKQLIAPGSSLGGARPKASVVAPDGSLWIAKFPSRNDDFNIGAWEMVAHDLAVLCKLDVPEAKVENFSKLGTTFLVKRFDRAEGRRVHFSSAMTMLGKTDGANAEDGSSYLEIASFIRANSSSPKKDLLELWKRIVFSMAISNTDDHFRNHGFIMTNDGWKLSPMFDVNPDIYGEYLSLNVDEIDSKIDFELAISTAKYYGIEEKNAREIVANIKKIVHGNWKKLAKKYNISRDEIGRMSPAFKICEL